MFTYTILSSVSNSNINFHFNQKNSINNQRNNCLSYL